MSASIEIQIQKLLHQFGDPQPVAHSLANRAQLDEFNEDETIAICHFCHRSGQYRILADLLIYLIEQKKELPWSIMPDLFWSNGLLVRENWSEALQDGAKENSQLTELSRNPLMRENFDPIKELHSQRVNRRFAEHAHRKTHLMDQIEIARAQQMIHEEKKHIEQLIKLFPNERIGHDQKQKLQERWAREILSRHASSTVKRWTPKEDTSEDYSDVLRLIFTQASKELKKSPELAQDFISMFVMFEDYEHALQIVQHSSSDETDWLQVEFLLILNRYVEALNLVGELESRYAKDPEVAFTAAYLKAQALWGLRKKEQALEIMESIVSARPTYRSAHSYLSLWRSPER